MSCPDIRDLQFGELTGPEQQRIREHLRLCEDCRLEAERLNVVVAMMKDVPAEEPLTRIRFVSDKVFEPRWWQRWFGSDRRFWAWQAAFSLPLWVMVAILLSTRAIPGRAPLSLHWSASERGHSGQQISQEQITAQVQKLVDQRVDAAVAKAVAEVETRRSQKMQLELAAFRSRYQRDQEQFHQAAYSFYRNLDQKMNRVALASMEKYPGSTEPAVNAQ
jgi:Putative zinc-finger